MAPRVDSPSRPAPVVEARPSPRVAAMLSLLVPGLGQAYCGAILIAPVFGGLAAVFILSLLQVWDELKRDTLSLLVLEAIVLGFYATTAVASSRHASRRARRMPRHAAMWRWFGWWWRTGGAIESASELLLLLAFMFTSAGVLLRWPLAESLAEALWYWPVFELLGGLSVGFYAAFIEDIEKFRMSSTPLPTSKIVAGMLIFQGAAATALYLLFRPPFLTVFGAAIVTLPGHIRTLAFLNDNHRDESKQRAGSMLVALILSFALAFVTTSFFEVPGRPNEALGLFTVMLMGTLYTILRLYFDALIRRWKE